MGRGFFSGVIWGSVIAVVALWLLSQLGGMVAMLATPPAEVVAVSPVETAGSEVEADEAVPAMPAQSSTPATDPSRQGSTLAGASTEQPPEADTQTGGAPAASGVANALSAPQAGEAPELEAGSDEPAVNAPASGGPALPEPEQAPVVSGAPEAPGTTQSAALTAPEETGPVVPNVGAAGDQPPVVASPPAQPEQPGLGTEDKPPAVTDFSTPQVVETPPDVAEEEPPATVEPPAETAPEAPKSTGKMPVVRKSGETVNGGGAGTFLAVGESSKDATEAETASVPETSDLTGLPAIQRYAQPFENPEGRPIMSIVLVPDANGGGSDALSLPFPVSVAVDASKNDAAERMAMLRSSGHEVVLLAPLPKGARPSDVEVAFQAYMAAVPEAVAVMDTRDAVFQAGRPVATQVAEALAASGQGMITYSRGLNSAPQVAEREGVPAALVFRVIDDDGRDGAAIKRFLDQAAFRAGQQSGVVLVAHDRPETIRALLEWSLTNRANTVALAPVSAALQAR